MTRSTNKATAQTNNSPTHEIVLKYTLPNDKETTIGRVGLFENNDVHKLISELNPTDLAKFLSKLTGEIVEYGENKREKLTSLF